MSQLVFNQPLSTAKLSNDPLKKDWNDFQHLATQGRYLSAKSFSGLQPQKYKLASVKKQIYNPKVPTIRRIERDEVLCRLPDEHCRHTSSFTEEQFKTFDPTRSVTFVEFSGLNWHDTGKALMGSNDFPQEKRETVSAYGARLRPDKSQVDTSLAENQIYRSPSLSVLSPSATLTKPIQYSYRNFGKGTFDQSTKHTMWPRFHMNTRNSFDPINRVPLPSSMENIFRSTSMYAGVSSAPWKPAGKINRGSNTFRV